MEHQSITEPGFGSSDHRSLEHMSIQELVCVLRTAFLTEDYDRVEEILVSRDKRLQTEILLLQDKFEMEKRTRIKVGVLENDKDAFGMKNNELEKSMMMNNMEALAADHGPIEIDDDEIAMPAPLQTNELVVARNEPVNFYVGNSFG
ncbi:hypothetical protein TSUD_256670 [Trifolium subterraneum]|uniref:Uncharacterized protein n=1 Tax=Trifolium subterraneum TaxID=3900 RepID=A0A2Z6N9H4_TRISU|nr:hypothetical protein TSUD_256670 [Trifolium subterraneum]